MTARQRHLRFAERSVGIGDAVLDPARGRFVRTPDNSHQGQAHSVHRDTVDEGCRFILESREQLIGRDRRSASLSLHTHTVVIRGALVQGEDAQRVLRVVSIGGDCAAIGDALSIIDAPDRRNVRVEVDDSVAVCQGGDGKVGDHRVGRRRGDGCRKSVPA